MASLFPTVDKSAERLNKFSKLNNLGLRRNTGRLSNLAGESIGGMLETLGGYESPQDKVKKVRQKTMEAGLEVGTPDYYKFVSDSFAQEGMLDQAEAAYKMIPLPEKVTAVSPQGKVQQDIANNFLTEDDVRNSTEGKQKVAVMVTKDSPQGIRMGLTQDTEFKGFRGDNGIFNPEIDTVTEINNLGRAETNISVNTGTKGSEALEKLSAGRVDSIASKGLEAQTQNQQLDSVLLSMAQGAKTGFGQELILDLKNAAQSLFGLEFNDSVGEQEVIRTISNQLALRMRNPESGLGLTGNTSNKDLNFLKASVIGLNRTPQGNRLIVKLMQRQNQLKIDLAVEAERIVEKSISAGKGIHFNINTQLMRFVNDYKFFTGDEKKQIERELKNVDPSLTEEDKKAAIVAELNSSIEGGGLSDSRLDELEEEIRGLSNER